MANVGRRTDSGATTPKMLVGMAVVVMVVVVGLVIVLERRLSWTPGWIYAGVVVAAVTINLACLLRWNPGLIRRRMRVRKFTKTWDKVWALFLRLAINAIYFAAILEARGRASSAPETAWMLGLVIFVLRWTLAPWSMVVKPFCEKTVRIQTDHGY